MSRRVVITGMGCVTPLGSGVEHVWSRLLKGDRAFRFIERFDASTFPTRIGAEIALGEGGFRLEDALGDRASAHEGCSIGTGFALAAAKEAWAQAGLGSHDAYRDGDSSAVGTDPRRFGIYLGSGEGKMDLAPFASSGIDSWDENLGPRGGMDHVKWAGLARERLSGVNELEQEPQMCLTHVAGEFGLRGPVGNAMTACAASTQAIGEAAELIRRGSADMMLAGGAHAMLHPLGMTGFIRLTAMTTRTEDPLSASRPFDASRDGFVMGEGAGVLVLESLESAQKRGATVLAELAGYGSTADAYRITDIHPEGEGARGAMRAALEQAGIDPDATDDSGRPPVHYISAHGTGTPENDPLETKAVKGVFGERATSVPFSSVKSMFGHLIQAAGAVELITCVKAIETGWIPPTMNLEHPDPRCDLDHVPNAARDLNPQGGVACCLSNSFGFGGQNDTACVTRFTG